MSTVWRPTRAFGRAVAIGLGFLVFAAIAGRADVAVLVTPLAVLVVWAMSTRPTQAPSATSAVSEPGSVRPLGGATPRPGSGGCLR